MSRELAECRFAASASTGQIPRALLDAFWTHGSSGIRVLAATVTERSVTVDDHTVALSFGRRLLSTDLQLQ